MSVQAGVTGVVISGDSGGSGGGGSYVRTLSQELSADTSVVSGDPITAIVVNSTGSDKFVVSFSGAAYTAEDVSVYLAVDGVKVNNSARAMTPGNPNTFAAISYVGVVEGLGAGPHTLSIVSGNTNFYLPISAPNQSGASMVVQQVSL